MKEDHNIEKLFQDVFDQFEVTPPVSVKAGIDSQLGKVRKRRFLFWWIALAVLFIGGIGFAISTQQEAKGDPENRISASDIESASPQEAPHAQPIARNTQAGTAPNTSPSHNGFKRNDSIVRKTASSDQPAQASRETSGERPIQTTSKVVSNNVSKQQVKRSSGKVKHEKRSKKSFPVDKNQKGNQAAFSNGNTSKPAEQKVEEEPGEKSLSAKAEKQQGTSQSDIRADSLVKTGTETNPVQKDSVSDVASQPDPESKGKPGKEEEKKRHWMLEVSGGPRFGQNTSKTDLVLKDANSYQVGLGFSRNLDLGPLKYVTLSGEYGSGKGKYTSESQTQSVYYVGIDSIPYYDTITGAIIGYQVYNNYDTLTNTLQVQSGATITRIAFGLGTQFNFNLKNGFGIGLAPGYYYARNTFRFQDSSGVQNAAVSGSQIQLNVSLYYDWNRFRFRVGLDSRYEWMGKSDHLFIDRRKSVLFLPQIGIGYKF